MQAMGAAWTRSVTGQITSWAKLGATIATTSALIGGAAMVANGLKFNKTMEDAKLQIASMYQMFGFLGDSAAVQSGEMTQWQANIGMAKAAMGELYDIAAKSPASFKQVASVYQNAAAGLATQTEDVRKHLEFMKGASLLGGLVGGDYEVLGSQLGRMLSGSAGAEMGIWKTMQIPMLEAGKKLGAFGKDLQATSKMTEEFNRLTGDQRLKIMLEAMKKIGPEVSQSYAESLSGIQSTTVSALEGLGGRLTSPLYESWREFLVEINNKDTGILGAKSLAKFQKMADYFAAKIDIAAGHLFFKVVAAAQTIRDNWEEISNTIYKAFQVGAGLIKGAFAYGMTKMIAGAALMTAGAGMRAAGAARQYGGKLVGFMGGQRRRAHTRIVRGAHGKQGGMLGGLGKLLAGLGKSSGITAFAARIASLGTVLVGVLPIVAMLAVAIGAIGAAFAGLAVYFVSHWEAIRASMVNALRSGAVTLEPLVAAAYVFWERLKAVGEAFLGGTSGAHMLGGMVNLAATAFMLAADAVSFFMRVLAIFIGIWGTLKLAFQGILKAVLEIIKAASYLPGGPSDETVARAQRNYDRYARGVQDTFTTVDKLLTKADKLEKINLKNLDFSQVEKDSKKLTKDLANFLEGLGTKEKKPTGGRRPVVKVDKVELNWDLRGEDPDRLMTAFMEPMERLADRRIQAYDTIDQGV